MTEFEEISVQRINIVAPDGSTRLVLTNDELCPAPIVDGQRFSRTGGGRTGMLFYNERGDECGGLIFAGDEPRSGAQAHAMLAFDHFRDDQAVALVYGRHGDSTTYGVETWDHDRPPLSEWAPQVEAVQAMPEGPERDAASAELPPWGQTRVFLGKQGGTVSLSINDRAGRPRIVLGLDEDDEPHLDFLDRNGNLVRRIGIDS